MNIKKGGGKSSLMLLLLIIIIIVMFLLISKKNPKYDKLKLFHHNNHVHHEISNPRHIDEHRDEHQNHAKSYFEEKFDIPNFDEYFVDNTQSGIINEVEIIDNDDPTGNTMKTVKICNVVGGKRPVYAAKHLGCIYGMELFSAYNDNNEEIWCCDISEEEIPEQHQGAIGRALMNIMDHLEKHPGQGLAAAVIGPILADVVLEGGIQLGKVLGKGIIKMTGKLVTNCVGKLGLSLTVTGGKSAGSIGRMLTLAKSIPAKLLAKVGTMVSGIVGKRISGFATRMATKAGEQYAATRIGVKVAGKAVMASLEYVMQGVLALQIMNEVMNSMDTGGYGQYIENNTIKDSYRDVIEANYINMQKSIGLAPPFFFTLSDLNILDSFSDNEEFIDVYSVYMDGIQSYHTQLLRNMKDFFDKSLEDKIIIQNAAIRGIELSEDYLMNIAPDINEKFEERDEFIWNYMQNHLQESSKDYVIRVPEVCTKYRISITLSPNKLSSGKSAIDIYNEEIEKMMKKNPDNPYPPPKIKWTKFYRDVNEFDVVVQKSIQKEFALLHDTGSQLIEHLCTEGMDPDVVNKKFPMRGRTCCAEWCKGEIEKPKEHGAGYDIDTGMCSHTQEYCEHAGYDSKEIKHFQCEGLGCDKNNYNNCKFSDFQQTLDYTPLPTAIIKDFAEHPFEAFLEVEAAIGVAALFATATVLTGGAAAGALVTGAAATAAASTVATAAVGGVAIAATAGAVYLAEGCPFTDTALGDALDLRDDGLYSREGEQDNKDMFGTTCGTEGAEC